jgi:DDE family transposase
MSAHSNQSRSLRQIKTLRNQFAQDGGLPFANLLTAERLERAFREEKAQWSERIFTPMVTVWAFLSQVLMADGSCRKAVARAAAWLVAQGRPVCRVTSDAYCKARQRLPETLLARLARETGGHLSQLAEPEWRFKGRRVILGDGSTHSMPDTPANQAAYPQSASQKAGVGFPIVRSMFLFCLATGAALNAAFAPLKGKKTGENSLLRTILDTFKIGDIALFDRYFSGYFDAALLKQRGVDMVTRGHQLRNRDFRKGQRLGAMDHVVTWQKPPRPEWMDVVTYMSLSKTMKVREVAVIVTQRGFRTEGLIVQTTLTDADLASAADLAQLYRCRWHVELDLRSLKITLGMDVLTCKTPEMVRKEIWARLLAYNLIRGLMAQSAHDFGAYPRDLSFKAAQSLVEEIAARLHCARGDTLIELRAALFVGINENRVNNRPDRVEPRQRKRRPKDYPHLSTSRQEAKARLAA